MTIETKIIFKSNHLFFDSNVKESFHYLAGFIIAKLKNWFAISIIVAAIVASATG